MKHIDDLTPYQRGRLARWRNKPIWVNPFLKEEAAEWRRGYLAAEAEQRVSQAWPTDLPRKAPPRRVMLPSGSGKASRHAKANQLGQSGGSW